MSTIESRTAEEPQSSKKRRRRLEHKRAIESEYQHYRAISFGAVVTMTIAILSIPAMLMSHVNPFLLILPLLGTVCGINTVLSLRHRTNEYIGFGYARTGLAISALTFGIGTFLAIYTYATEVPEGYARISYSDLQPVPARKDIPFSPKAAELSQQKVFLKGYLYPDSQMKNIKRFVLVPDMGTCCFGGQPKLTDMIQVTLRVPLRTKYSYARRSIAGTFRLGAAEAGEVGNVIYHLDADYAR